MQIYSRHLLLATEQLEQLRKVYASEEALQAALDIGNAIKINDGMGEDLYRYTAYPISTTKSGDFTYTSRIKKIKTKDNETFYYASFNVPTNTVSLDGVEHYSAYTNNGNTLLVVPNSTGGTVYDTNLVALDPQPTVVVQQGGFQLQPAATVVGSPTEVDGVYTINDGSNYVRTTNDFNPGSDSWEMCFMFNLSSYSGRLFGAQADRHLDAQFNGSYIQFLMSTDGSYWDIGIQTTVGFSLNTNYWLKLGYNGSSYYVKYSTTGINGTYLDAGSSSAFAPSLVSGCGYITFGNINGHATGHYMNGKLGFKDAYIQIGNTKTYLGKSLPDFITINNVDYTRNSEADVDKSLNANVTTFGDQDNANVTINVDQNQNGLAYKNNEEQIVYISEDNKVFNNLKQYISPQPSKEFINQGYTIHDLELSSSSLTITNGVASNFSTSNFLQTINNFSPSNNTWKIGMNFTLNGVPTTNSSATLIGSCGTDNILFRILDGTSFYFLINSVGNAGWDVLTTTTGKGTYTFSANVNYDLLLEFTGTAYVATIKPSNGEWTEILRVSSTTPLVSNLPWRIGNHKYSGGTETPFNGSVDLTKCYFVIGEERTDLCTYSEIEGVEINNVFYTRTSASDVTDLPITINSTAGVETSASAIRNYPLLECDSLTGYDLVKIENSGQLYSAGIAHLVDNNSATTLALKYNNKLVHYEQQITNTNLIKKAHNVTINPSVSDCTIKFYDKTSSTGIIQGWSNQKIDYEVSKEGYDTKIDSYTIPNNNVDNQAYTVNVIVTQS